jgi:hypothetical protein
LIWHRAFFSFGTASGTKTFTNRRTANMLRGGFVFPLFFEAARMVESSQS